MVPLAAFCLFCNNLYFCIIFTQPSLQPQQLNRVCVWLPLDIGLTSVRPAMNPACNPMSCVEMLRLYYNPCICISIRDLLPSQQLKVKH